MALELKFETYIEDRQISFITDIVIIKIRERIIHGCAEI